MEPKAVAPGLVARHHRGVCGETEAELGLLDLVEDGTGQTGRNRAKVNPRGLAGADGEGHFPGTPAQLKKRHRAPGRLLG